MQKNGYAFSGKRADCYISDAILRQYTREKEKHGRNFSYNKMKCCYLIVLMENSPKEFTRFDNQYLHIKDKSYSSKNPIETIIDIRFISLDTYDKVRHNRPVETSLDAWLTFLSTKDFTRINELIHKYPEFIDMYKEIAEFCRKPKELIGMFLTSFAEADRATERYMIDEMKKEIEEDKKIIAENKAIIAKDREVIAKMDKEIAEKDALIAELRAQLEQKASN